MRGAQCGRVRRRTAAPAPYAAYLGTASCPALIITPTKSRQWPQDAERLPLLPNRDRLGDYCLLCRPHAPQRRSGRRKVARQLGRYGNCGVGPLDHPDLRRLLSQFQSGVTT